MIALKIFLIFIIVISSFFWGYKGAQIDDGGQGAGFILLFWLAIIGTASYFILTL
jgi:nitrogen fixation-related uncharacterized protein